LVRPVVSRFGTRRVQLRGRRRRDPWSRIVRTATALRRPSGQLTMGSAMDAPYLDPSRGPRDKAGVVARTARLLGLVMFVTGVILGCYVGLRWLQTGRVEATLIEDVVVARLPDGVRAWVVHPSSWYGLHRFVVWILRIPFFASVAFAGFLVLLATATRGGNRAV
jgi:hypothetical protein